ncbi:cell envelope biogenesis protein TolA [Spirilliplanes yamanashiensis]|uniref:Flagellar FliJ protein n=1 Tax=Spirilliplanes yamanashiensis TaxID=42233 RepID=A0A8J3Y611_9ACTN|nr:cell envelope biogenesis protein TolA [Spirilliplanes yamanashiensis]MDP9814381.1 hypothetical protein [Spirilliplanes yamanashiensis]GIJ02034.1 hypothetical protein Sya03_13860 [Spirilliplanes yamanashiensis]
MNRRFKLGPVLRARQAQEDLSRSAVIQARVEAESAAALVKRRQLELVGGDAPNEGTARAMVASMVARQSLAAGLFAAARLADEATDVIEVRQAELAEAAKRRRAVELLAERHAATVKAHELASDQREIDELAVTMKARNAARGLDGTSERRAHTMRHGHARPAGDTA